MTMRITNIGNNKYELTEIVWIEGLPVDGKTEILNADEIGEIFYEWRCLNGSWIANEMGAEDDERALEMADNMVSNMWNTLDIDCESITLDICEL